MSLKAVLVDGLLARAELEALACVDLESGAVLGAEVRSERSREALGLRGRKAAAQLLAAPRLDSMGDEDELACEACSSYRSPRSTCSRARKRCPDVVVVGGAATKRKRGTARGIGKAGSGGDRR